MGKKISKTCTSIQYNLLFFVWFFFKPCLEMFLFVIKIFKTCLVKRKNQLLYKMLASAIFPLRVFGDIIHISSMGLTNTGFWDFIGLVQVQ